MTKKISKLISMLLAAVMVLSMAVTGLAAEINPMASSEDTYGSITINNAEIGETYSIYQIFEMTYADDEEDDVIIINSYSYKVVDAWAEFISSYMYGENNYLFDLDVNGYLTASSAIFDDSIATAEVLAAFAQAALAYATQNDITATATQQATSNKLIFYDLKLGYYLVDSSLGSLCFLDSTDPDAVITEKNDVPTPDKKILEDSTEVEGESSDNTKTVTYVLYANNVTGAVNLVIHDQMSVEDGITYIFDYSNMKVGLYDENNSLIQDFGTGTTSNYYTLTNPTDPDKEGDSICDFHVTFTEAAEELFSTCSNGSYVKVTIDCTLDAGEYAFADDEVDIKNQEKVSYGNNGSSEWDTVDVYEYGFEIYKYTGETENDDGTIGTPLANAEFELKNADNEVAYFIKNDSNKYVLEGWGEIPESSEDYVSVIVTDSEGKAYIEGLAEGTYTLTETKAPDGYNLLVDKIEVTITAMHDADGNPTSTFTVTYTGANNNEDHIVKIINNSGSILPGTGGIGTTIFYVVGTILILAAAALVVAKMRLGKTE